MARKRRNWSITAGFARNRRIWSGGTPVYGQEKEELVNNSRICQEQEDSVRYTSLWSGKGGTIAPRYSKFKYLPLTQCALNLTNTVSAFRLTADFILDI